MLSKVLAAVGLVVVVAIGAYFYTQSPDGGSSKSPTKTVLRSHIPADSFAFILNEKPVPLELLVNADPSLEQFAQMAESAMQQEQEPAIRFWAHLGSAYVRALQSGVETLQEQWGFGDDIYGAAYFVGLSPVIELPLADPAQFSEQVRAAAKAAGLTMQTDSDSSASLHRVTFFEEDGRQVTLLLRESDGWMRVALELPGGEDNVALVSGVHLPTQSLATSDLLERIDERFDVRADVVAATNFVALAATLTEPESTAGTMLSKMIPELDLSQWRTPACQQEMAEVTAAVPEWLLASEVDYDVQGQPRQVTSRSQSLLSIRSEPVASSLAKLNGVLPDYSGVDGFDPLYSFGLGLNVAQLAPVLMELHQAALAKTFECEYLRTAQNAIREANPAMLGMATAMVSGVKGLSFTLNEVQLADNLQEVESASALISLSTESVSQLLILAQGFVPGLAQLDIPEDGSAVPLESPMLPAQLPPLLIAVKDDQHAVIMTDDDLSQRLASSFSGRGVEGNGFISVAMDAGKLVEMANKPMQQGFAGMAAVDPSTCADITLLQGTYSNMQLSLNGELRFHEAGLWASGTATQSLPERDGMRVHPGTFDAYFLGEGCELERDGSETFNADGSGQMSTTSPEPGCDNANYEARFQWQQRGLGLYYSITEERERQSCNGEWSEWAEASGDGQDKNCVITAMDDTRFSCVFADEEDGSYAYVFKRAAAQ